MSHGGDPALKFVIDIQNADKINKLTNDIKDQEDEIKKYVQALNNGKITQQQFLATTKSMGEAIAKSTKEMQAIQGAAGTAGRGLSQLSYAIDDIQYGFNAIVNNIPQIVMGFGAGAGVAGAVGIAAVAINQLIKHWGDLSDIAQTVWAGGSIEQLHNLREAAEEATKAFDKLTKEHTKMQEESLKFIHGAIVEGGVGKELSGLAGGIAMEPGMRAELTAQESKDRQDKIAMANRLANPTDRISQLAKIEENYGGKLATKNRDKAVAMLAAIDKGDPIAMRNAHRFAMANPGAFPAGFAAKMNPEAAEADKVRKANIEADIQGNKNIRQAEKEAEAEKLRKNKELTAEGARLETQGKREQLEQEKRDIQERIRRGEHVLSPEGKRQLQDQMLGGKAPESSQIMSMKSFADKMLTSGMNSVPQKQLDTLKDMHTELKSIDKKIGALGLQ